MTGAARGEPQTAFPELYRAEEISPCHPLRTSVETMVRAVYAASYGARIAHFPRRMLAVIGPGDLPLCAAGLRDSESGFFSECYLERSIEAEVSARLRRPVARGEIMEVTTLAAHRTGYAFGLIDCAIRIGRAEGIHWGLCTATAPLRRSMARVGAPLLELCDAEASRVREPEAWGSYYSLDPKVCLLQDPKLRPPYRPGLPNLPVANEPAEGAGDA
ncbi:thermostable hemolysin [Limibacillus halophilus]|jgi:hypothetical protein